MTTALDIIGQTFDHTADGTPTQRGWDELTRALSIYSDKRYETARYLFIQDGKIARHVAVSSRQPSETIARPDDNFLYTLQDYAERTKSSVVFVHNHPSGHIVPSEADIKLTSMLENVFTDRSGERHLLGHAILDHGNFGLYTPQSGWKALIDGKITELYEAEQAHNEGTSNAMQIHTDTDLMDVAEYVKQLDGGTSWDKTKWVHSVLTDITGIVTTHELIGIDEFEAPDTLIRKLKDVGREYGSPSIYLFPTDSTQHSLCERFAADTRAVRDVYYEREQGGFELSQSSGGSLFSQITAEDITVEDTNMLDLNAVRERMERGGKADAMQTVIAEHGYTDAPSSVRAQTVAATNDDSIAKQQAAIKEAIMTNENITQRDMSRVAVIDIKTSGPVYDDNEILQVSVKDGNGKDLLSTYVMPNKIQSWPSVIENTHIMPQMVSNAPEFYQIHDKLQDILDNADMIVSYDGELGAKFLEANHIDVGKTKPHIDMMRAFAPVYGEKQDSRLGTRHTTDGYKWKPLDIACEHYGMIINKYDATDCTKGVLAMAKTMYGDGLERLSEEDFRLYAINDKRRGENDAKYIQAKKRFASAYPNTDMDKLQSVFDKVANTNRYELEKENFKVYKSAIDGADISHDETPSPARDASKPRYDGEETHPFSRQTAFFRGTVVPDFGSYNPDAKKLELLHGFRFETAQSIALNLDGSEAHDKDGKPIYGVPRDNDPNKMIVLSKMDDDGKRVERQVPEHQYRHMIDTQMSFEAERENAAEHTWEWTKVHDDYAREMEIDMDKPRLNIWENFVHNFQLRCKLYANNPKDAMRQAKFLVDDMMPQQRKRFNERLRMHGELEFNKMLVQKYKDIKDEEKVDKFYFTTEGQGAQNEALALVAKEDREQKPGTAIADTHFKVGDIIPMSFRTKGFNVDNAIESPISDYQIAKVSKGFRPERAILYSKEARSMYCVPLTDLVGYLQKYEQQRKSKRELTKQDYIFTTEQERAQEKKSMLKKTQNAAKNIVRAVKDKYYVKHYEGR